MSELRERVSTSLKRTVHALPIPPNRRRPEGEISPFYGATYFGNRTDDGELSGYDAYDRTNSNANIAAYLLWRFVPFTNVLDVGCAKGFLVEALCELGFDAYGCDISTHATQGAIPAIRPRLRVVDLQSEHSRSQLVGERYSLITMLEVLEHLRPDAVPDVLAFVRTIASGYVVATIPSFGVNRNGPPGFIKGKVHDDRLQSYVDLGESYTGPIPHDDLKRDSAGHPLEGHLTMASFDWWEQQFASAGFTRVDAVERPAQPVIGRFDLSMTWNFYVFHVDGKPPAAMPSRDEVQLATLERRWGLDQIPLQARSVDYNRNEYREEAARAIEMEFENERKRQARFDELL